MQVKYYIDFNFCTYRSNAMSTNYLDTVTMYYNCPFDLRRLFTCHWIFDGTNQDRNLHHFCTKTDHAFMRFFPDMYGVGRLYVTFSLPKLYYQCNRNTYNVTGYDNQTFMDTLYSELGKAMDVSKMPTALADWQPSRIDLFRMRAINPLDRKEYLYGYGRLAYRGAVSTTYLNTNYLPSSKNGKCPNLLLRTYNKTIEEQDKRSLSGGSLPSMVENDHERLMHEFDVSPDQYRYEFSLRRAAAKRFCAKFNKPLDMETIMSEGFQKIILNELVLGRGLHHAILSKKEFRHVLPKIFPTQKSIDLALKLAESIRNKKPAPMKPHQEYRIRRELNSWYISTATTNFVSIKGLELLS